MIEETNEFHFDSMGLDLGGNPREQGLLLETSSVST